MPAAGDSGARWGLLLGALVLVAVVAGTWWVWGPPSRDAGPSAEAVPEESTEPSPGGPDRASENGTVVPSEVVARLESAPGRLDEVLAPEAVALGVEVEGALPGDAELTVVADSWSVQGGSATLVAEVTLPGQDAETHLVVLADVEGQWLVAATYLVEP